VKVWIYKGDILPYKLSSEDKISREAAMAAGETSGQSRPRRLITAGGGRRRAEQGELPGEVSETDGEAGEEIRPEEAPDVEVAAAVDTGTGAGTDTDTEVEEVPVAPLPGTAPVAGEVDDLERLLAEEEEIERRTRTEHHETPHFRKEND
jgi:small subunit ribosomal protein S3